MGRMKELAIQLANENYDYVHSPFETLSYEEYQHTLAIEQENQRLHEIEQGKFRITLDSPKRDYLLDLLGSEFKLQINEAFMLNDLTMIDELMQLANNQLQIQFEGAKEY